MSIPPSSSLRLALLALLSLLLGACGSSGGKVGGVFESRDGAPSERVDVANIPNAVPKVEPRARYGNPKSYEVFGKRYYVMKSAKGYKERGIASWYGTKFHGRRTSSGEPYDLHGMTAAHKSLPLPTYVRVTHLKNGRSVIVKVNDRGPFHGNRIIDLSHTAAVKLGIKATGTGFVEVEAIDPTTWGRSSAPQPAARPAPPPREVTNVPVDPPGRFYLQVGAFSSRGNAERLARRLEGAGLGTTRVSEVRLANGPIYRVRIGPLASAAEAERIADLAIGQGIANPRVVSD